ncbi:hypothetical protein [Haloferax sulfurifontis]|uniref:hypothetical protein n=1 Tax=Haloferax sulfurifontis TaxID=255616 RepID=UPI00126791B9|nr:hypothetical protein [Haloferax sulfurifontis]
MTDRPNLRQLEAVTLCGTVTAFILTLLSITTGVSTESNPLTAVLFEQIGFALSGLFAVVGISLAFAVLERFHSEFPNTVLLGATVLGLFSVMDVLLNLFVIYESPVLIIETLKVRVPIIETVNIVLSAVVVFFASVVAFFRNAPSKIDGR